MDGKIVFADLRIGNKVLHSGTEIEVVGINKNAATHQHHHAYFHELSGIPITAKLLLNYGFEEEERKSFPSLRLYLGDSVYLVCRHNSDEIYIDKPEIEDDHYPDFAIGIAECKYLHQLQNIYFLLTGEELVPLNSEQNAQECDATDAK